jgi:hypothetical protein
MTRFLLFLSVLLFSSAALAQQKVEKTTETRVEIDSATGQRKVISAETVHSTEDITIRNNMLIINPLKFFYMYNLSYYRRLNETMVIGAGLQTPSLTGLSGFGANVEARFHPSGKAMRGFYVAPNASFNSLSTDFTEFGSDGSERVSTTTFSVGGLVGWQWFPGDDFAIGLGIGVDYYFLSGDYKDSTGSNPFGSYDGTFPALRFDIGYAW